MVNICLTINFVGIEELSHFNWRIFDKASSLARIVKILTKQG